MRTLPASRRTRRTRNVPYGSETILLLGEPAETRAFCHETLSARGYDVLEAANFQHADSILDQLEGSLDLILGWAASEAESAALTVWYSRYRMFPLLVLNCEDYRGTPDANGAEIALSVRLALEAARPCHRILIVDGDQSERMMLAELLGRAGYEVREASNGKEALMQLTTNTPELLLTDIVMPEKDGLELLQDVRKHYPAIATIAISGTTRTDRYLAIARLLGAKYTLQKPISIDHLLRALREFKIRFESNRQLKGGGSRDWLPPR